jgi:hypothetical protein
MITIEKYTLIADGDILRLDNHTRLPKSIIEAWGLTEHEVEDEDRGRLFWYTLNGGN